MTNTILSAFFSRLDVPVVDAAIGPTGYLDETLTGAAHVVAKGRDERGRPFFRFAAIGKNHAGREAFAIFTVFKRYSDAVAPAAWVVANNTRRGGFPLLPSGAVTAEGAQFVTTLLLEGHANYALPGAEARGTVRLATKAELAEHVPPLLASI